MATTTTTFTKNFYHVLSLDSPRSTTTNTTLTSGTLRKAYKTALLTAHPDKASAQKASSKTTPKPKSKSGAKERRREKEKWTVDDVKEAYAVLSDERKRREFDEWLRSRPSAFASWGKEWGEGEREEDDEDEDFILGLEVLDLADFREEYEEAVGEGGEGAETVVLEWRKECRCGDGEGFRIREEELERAAERGETEVLVGCGGCSLWVRVGFGVEGEGEG